MDEPSQNQPENQPTQPSLQILVAGQKLTIDLNAVFSPIVLHETVIWWADQLGRARYEARLAIAEFHTFQAEAYMQANVKDPKWKIDAAIEVSKGFLVHQERIANTERAVTVLEAMLRELEHHRQAQSKAGIILGCSIEKTETTV